MIAEYDAGTDDLLRLYVYGPGIDEPLLIFDYTVATPQVYYYHYDALGNIVALSDNNGDIVERYGYDAYGNVSIHTSAGANGMWMDPDDDVAYASAKGNPYLFTGRRYDSDTALYYYRARYYSPDLGRFISADPIGYLGGLNLYSYCGNNPINWIDPYGLLPWQLYNPERSGELLESISNMPPYRRGPWTWRKVHSYEETQRILKLGRSRSDWNEILHFLPPWTGGYDYKGWNMALLEIGLNRNEFFTVGNPGTPGAVLTDSQFGNYIAGYLTQWHRGTVAHVHFAGDIEAGGKDDCESTRDINRGAKDAAQFRKEWDSKPWWRRLFFLE